MFCKKYKMYIAFNLTYNNIGLTIEQTTNRRLKERIKNLRSCSHVTNIVYDKDERKAIQKYYENIL